MRIAMHLSISEIEQKICAELPEMEFIHIPRSGDIPDIIEVDVLLTLGYRADNLKEVIANCQGLRWIHVYGTGIDEFPLDCIGDEVLTCSRGVSTIPISEWVLATMLAYEKRLPESWISSQPDYWSTAQLGTLYGKTLGLIGLGTIAQGVVERAQGFSMEIIASVRNFRPSAIAAVEILESMDEVLAKADHLVLTLPSISENKKLFDRDLFVKMKRGVHIINIARGDIIDQHDLLAALDSGQVGFASLDVVDPEPLPTGHPLYDHPKVNISPHISWSYPEARALLQQNFLNNLTAFITGEGLTGIVDIKAGY
tara:strand:+ start:1780 stop:2715 length:936 start_codon:yes stop_codon:yes gene_type:complete